MQFTLGVIGIGILSSAVGGLKNGAVRISNWLISWASSQTLPTFIEAQLTGEGPLPSSVWWFLGISGIVFAVLPLTTIEGGIQKLNRRRFHLEETNRLEGLFTPKMEALKQHQNALSQLVR